MKLAVKWLSKQFPDMSDYLTTLPRYRIILMVDKHFSGGWNNFLNNLNKL